LSVVSLSTGTVYFQFSQFYSSFSNVYYVASNASKAVHDELEKNWTLNILGTTVISARYDCGILVRIFGLRNKKWTLDIWNTNRSSNHSHM